MQECVVKEPKRCIWFTKENKDELLMIEEPTIYNEKSEFQIRETDDYICIDYCGAYKVFYYYNHWYVEEDRDYDYTKFYGYTEEVFKKLYKLCNSQ